MVEVFEIVQRPSNRLRFSTVRQLELSPVFVEDIQSAALIRSSSNTGAQLELFRNDLSQTFQSLERIVLSVRSKEENDVQKLRNRFKKPNLEVLYSENVFW